MKKSNLNIEHKCDVCGRTFKDQAYLRQHRRGTHGRGWTVLSGVVVDWLPKLHQHQKNAKIVLKLNKSNIKKIKLANESRLSGDSDSCVIYFTKIYIFSGLKTGYQVDSDSCVTKLYIVSSLKTGYQEDSDSCYKNLHSFRS